MKLLATIGLGIACLVLQATESNRLAALEGPLVRTMINLNEGWQYSENNTADLAAINQETHWEAIDLPHTWNQWDAMDAAPGYRRDASWYQKDITVPEAADGARYHLYFEGANITTDVYVNGTRAGGHVGGYVGFEVDITDQVKPAEKNTVTIRVDNSYNPNVIPSQKADFFIYGGITRDLWLKVLPVTHIAHVAVATPEVSADRATTEVRVQLNQKNGRGKKAKVRCQLMDASGRVVAEEQMRVRKLPEDGLITLPAITQPALWSPDSPNLYTLKTQLLEGEQVVDEQVSTVGYRWFRFEPYGAFYLNGERLLLRGTHRHEEHAGYGAAMPNALHVADIRLMKEMGVNFLRLGHYPQDPEVYRACNEMGIIVWDELPWCRGGLGEAEWQANTERLLREQINQNINHPSILFWSLGNEIYWLPDFEGGDDESAMNAYLTKLNTIAHTMDPYRQTAIRKYYAGADLVDVFSPSIWSGWYAGVYTNYGNTLKKNQQKYKQFLHMEYGGSSHVGRHTENPITGTGSVNEDDWAEVANQVNVKNIAKGGDWTETYIVDLFDYHLSVSETLPGFAGNAQWAFKDFGTPLRPQNAIPYVNQKGLVDRAGKPKDAFYVYKSYWGKEPFAYIESHTWTHRRGPKGKLRNIAVFSNCDEVELLHDGKALGRKTRDITQAPACGLNWDVNFKEGANKLVARAYKDGNLIATDEMTVSYDYQQPGDPDRVHLEHKSLDNGNLLVEATMRDKNGLRVYDYEQELYFTLDGQGELLKHYGTPTRSNIIQMANGYAAIELTPAEFGRAIIEARNQDFKGSYLVIDFSTARK
ncbi:glycoside hydrolase family 2 TIM barrel-domain containing protein [Lewinella sp. 4G2]|uniref:glycoside hydrolase family 2 protein n=1 Tax=Lewinella sp. 4G2 TaxID=1803372 RepID=UPI0007B49D3D|nr:glycoside hydrolase family 2 TIM barrel-domain containing protein [Lewinella sp. 4G2]OAV43131.1 beta-galactosidase [Lewinella sp. 4G2]